MSSIDKKKILIGISGGIAAYKVPLLIRLLIKKGAEVKVVATSNALEFVTPLTLQTLCGNKVYKDMFGEWEESTTEHIALADWGDCMIVAPASADVIGKYANGIADNALTTTLSAFNKPVFLCPAMNSTMYFNKAVQRNLNLLRQDGVRIIDSEEGFLACGTSGKGRMEEPEIIVQRVEEFFSYNQTDSDNNLDFSAKKVTITAGPTRERIDDVRFISNNSSGRMGIALAEEFTSRGVYVDLVLGPVSIQIPNNKNLNVINVESASEMYAETLQSAKDSSVVVCAAAVADYTPREKYDGKMKKKEDNLHLDLVPTKDILKELGIRKSASQILVGFALETDNELENAKLKLKKKNLDFIVLNSLKDKGAGFEVSTNKVTIIDKSNKVREFPLKDKREVAKDIVNLIKEFF
ncbi:MAG: bifunctional phosphopantothenoylcysteine decarboxylase/phosphopantothenate--cysteine ligase CoaBC [Bacteroidales bacterium]|nr:bifunctional phosphopantothenoylcysteine decarboxylase/phosphopantothenate--cysteine ligase CoaBC [Bacteroidales bacterium]